MTLTREELERLEELTFLAEPTIGDRIDNYIPRWIDMQRKLPALIQMAKKYLEAQEFALSLSKESQRYKCGCLPPRGDQELEDLKTKVEFEDQCG